MAYLLNIDKELLHELKIIAVRDSISIKEIILKEITEYVKIHKDGNSQHLLEPWMENEDFMGYPAMSIKHHEKEKHLQKMPEDMREQLRYHIQEWVGLFNKL